VSEERRVAKEGAGVSAVVVKDGEPGTVTARWLVGCNGGHSIVRKQAGIPLEGETRENMRMIVADVAVDGLERDARHTWRRKKACSRCARCRQPMSSNIDPVSRRVKTPS
jgi:2-polyprenyl-6-methoxyphenol hydroxylase-like FAD-dependent oxidoreductase